MSSIVIGIIGVVAVFSVLYWFISVVCNFRKVLLAVEKIGSYDIDRLVKQTGVNKENVEMIIDCLRKVDVC